MAEIQKAITDYLALDFTLTQPQPGGLGFLVWSRWLVAGTGPGSTPEAFNAGAGGRLRRNIVVLDGGEVDHPSPRPGRDWRTWDSFPTTHLFAEAHANGKAAIDAAIARMETLLVPWRLVLPSGQRVSFEPDSRLVLEDSDQFPGNVVAVVRWRATGARRLAA
jgi:hypothetical protein